MNNALAGVHQGWAVASKFEWGWSLLGPGWFGWGLPSHADGVRTAVFSTRKAAREALAKTNNPNNWKFRIMRVQCMIVERRPGRP